jgi:hypothetical protein
MRKALWSAKTGQDREMPRFRAPGLNYTNREKGRSIRPAPEASSTLECTNLIEVWQNLTRQQAQRHCNQLNFLWRRLSDPSPEAKHLACLHRCDCIRATLGTGQHAIGLVVIPEPFSAGIPVDFPLQLHRYVMDQAGGTGPMAYFYRCDWLFA